jgi:hypothetical protein
VREENPGSLRDPSYLQGFFSASEAEAGPVGTDRSAEHDIQMLTSTSGGSVSTSADPSTRDAEDVGMLTDNKWELVAAHERRFCFSHKEDEWLLEYAERWMYPSDFSISGAEVTLKDKLQKYLLAGSNSRPHKQALRAECNHSLWSQVTLQSSRTYQRQGRPFDPVEIVLDYSEQRRRFELGTRFTKARNREVQRRRSERVKETAEATMAKREKMMVVVDLEDL